MNKRTKGKYIYEWSDDNEKFFGTYERAEAIMAFLERKIEAGTFFSSGSFGIAKLLSGELINGLTLRVTLHYRGKLSTDVLVSPSFAEKIRKVQNEKRYEFLDDMLEEKEDE